MARSPAFLLPFLLLCLSFLFGHAIAKPSSTPPVARKEDIKYIKCAVCHEISHQLSRQIKQKRDELAPKQLSEYQIIEVAENICNLKRIEGDWLLHQDIVEQGDKLVLLEQEDEGECNTECKTIEKACQEVMGYHDTDVAEFLFKGPAQTDLLSEFLCKDLSKACRGKIPAVPKDRKPGEAFTPKSSKDAEMEKIMRSMSDMPGAPNMKMYSREDLMNGMPNFNGDDVDDDDDDDEAETLRKGNKARDKGTPINQFVNHGQSVLSAVKQGTQHAIGGVQKQFKKASDWFGRWWAGETKSEQSKSTTAEL